MTFHGTINEIAKFRERERRMMTLEDTIDFLANCGNKFDRENYLVFLEELEVTRKVVDVLCDKCHELDALLCYGDGIRTAGQWKEWVFKKVRDEE